MAKKTWMRFLSIVLVIGMLLGTLPAYALPDEAAQGYLPGYEQDYNSKDLHDYKYFKIYEKSGGTPLGEGTIGGSGEFRNPMIPDGRGIVFEFLNEKTQEIRLELWENNNGVAGAYLGLIACGTADGQWGVLTVSSGMTMMLKRVTLYRSRTDCFGMVGTGIRPSKTSYI